MASSQQRHPPRRYGTSWECEALRSPDSKRSLRPVRHTGRNSDSPASFPLVRLAGLSKSWVWNAGLGAEETSHEMEDIVEQGVQQECT